MNKLKMGINKNISAGTFSAVNSVNEDSIRLVNMISLLTISILLIAAVLDLIYSSFNIIYDILCVIIFTVPVVLNYFGKQTASKILLLLIFFSTIYLGTFYMKFGEIFHVTIIIPISLVFIFFNNIRGWKLYSLLVITITYIIVTLTQVFGQSSGVTVNQYIDWGLFVLTIAIFIYSHIFFSRQVALSRGKLKQQLQFEKAISEFSQLILSNGSDSLKRGLELILNTSKTSRIFIYEYDSEFKYIGKTQEVCAPGVKQEIDNPVLQHVELHEIGFSRWVEHFEQRRPISGNLSDFPVVEKKFLEKFDIKSILAIPIYSNHKWIGYIGFSDIYKYRVWDDIHIHLLTAVANMVGMHIKKLRDGEKIKQQNEELLTLNATKDKFFSIVAHDLRNPYNSLIGFSTLLEEELEGVENITVKNYSALINKGLLGAYSYLNNLLEWSRLQTKRTTYLPSTFQLNNLIDETIGILNLQAQSKAITINTSFENEMVITADKNMIKTVVLNLITNAIKYSYKGEHINVSCFYDDGCACISIEDNGIGITKDRCDKLFSINESVSTRGTMDESGTGLGLILCKEFIDLHKGHITLSSEIKKGSTFQINIPV
ncbi:ATP-binding protein [Saccharicrinis sp. FJH62]|uniref:GAF domain-containing sensor histidine kinase n=1 Tax=Saccharicrinis sp. FJH62 TaxID=3344657 RepID=UPI0035D4A818